MKLEKAIEILEHNWTQLYNPFYKEEELKNALNMVTKTLNQTVKAEPIRHGRWVVLHGVLAGDDIYGDMGECSNCGLHLRNYEWDYCPNCGAKMDEVTE